jgi:acyl transferase domain-containing protein
MKQYQTTAQILEETPDAIALIGAATRFPGASDLTQYRALLTTGVSAIRPASVSATLPDYYQQIVSSPHYVPVTATLASVDRFDAGFFGLTPREALILDPQQRHILECVWHAFENAGIVPGDTGDQRTAVFTSTAFSSYLTHLLMPRIYAGLVDVVEAGLACNADFAASRLAYKFNLKGPALAVQTACSSSLVATHLACRSLAGHESDLAVVAAASITVPNGLGYVASDKGMVAVDGRCRPFLASATGTVFGNGAGAILLRRLDQAVENRDRIMAVLRGSAVNNDGSQRVGFTAPAIDGQSAVIAEAMGVAEVAADDIGYIEAHGTGTPLGDPIEISALHDAYGDLHHRIPVGTAKGQIGHLDTVAGLAGLVRVATILQNGTLPATVDPVTAGSNEANPKLDLDRRPFRLLSAAEPWQKGPQARIAALSSFGMGGTNAHAILQEAPEPRPAAKTRTHELIVVSGRAGAEAVDNCQTLGRFLSDHPEADLADTAFTLRQGRKAFETRHFCVAETRQQAADALLSGRTACGTASVPRKLAFVLPGQGSQYASLALELAGTEPLFATHFARLRQQILEAGGCDIAARDLTPQMAAATQYAQPVLFACGVALGKALLSLGAVPDTLIGHSVGEIAAACLAGVLTEQDACALVVARATAMAAAPPGAMLQLSCPPQTAVTLIREIAQATGLILSPVAFNGQTATVAGGEYQAIDRLEAQARTRGLNPIRLRTSHAFHTPIMDQAAETLAVVAAKITFSEPRIPVISTLTGQPAAAGLFADPQYWTRQMLSPVRYGQALENATRNGIRLFVELGPPGGLAAALSPLSHNDTQPAHSLSLLPSRHQAEQAGAATVSFLQGLGTLWAAGKLPDWTTFEQPFLPRNKTELPGYSFRPDRHWPDEDATSDSTENDSPPDKSNAAHPTRLGLPRQPRPHNSEPVIVPEDGPETMLASLWEELLLITPISRHDDFVALGGASITALQLVQALATRGWQLTVRDVFEHRVLSELAGYLRHTGTHSTAVSQPAFFDDDDDDVSLPDPETLATIRSQLKA